MKITDIERQKYNPSRLNIYVDNKFAIGVDEEVKIKYKLEIGMEVDEVFLEEILKKEEEKKIVDLSLRYLAYRQRSEQEVSNYLSKKAYPSDLVEYAIEYCKSRGYINDEEFAKAYAKDKLNINKLGPSRIKYELRLKGIDQDIISRVVNPSSNKEYENALELGTKQAKKYAKDPYNKAYAKLSGFLQRRGYSYDIINKVVKEVLPND